jgi:hypothetical protein
MSQTTQIHGAKITHKPRGYAIGVRICDIRVICGAFLTGDICVICGGKPSHSLTCLRRAL